MVPSLIIGLGNPGRDYRRNRHNAGAMVVDRVARRIRKTFQRRVGESLVVETRWDGRAIVLAKPTLYMNEAGRAVASLVRTYRLGPSALLVICDDLDLPLGRIRLRSEGGSAGHRGLASIIDGLESQDFPRLRVGIGRPPGTTDAADYVLEDFLDEEMPTVEEVLDRAERCVWHALDAGIPSAMNEFNPAPSEE
jgi:PTH1 family peptidyl-tRNA hydrolase